MDRAGNAPNYMQAAAEKAINDLQQQVDNAQRAAEAAKNSADSVARSAALWKKLTVGLLVGFLLLGVVCGFGARLYLGQRDVTNNLRQQAVRACMIGNDRAAGTVTALNELVKLLEGPNPTADTQKKAAAYDAFVLSHNQQRDCTKEYPSSADG